MEKEFSQKSCFGCFGDFSYLEDLKLWIQDFLNKVEM